MGTRIILLLVSVLFFACGTHDDLGTLSMDNTFVAQRDGQTWNGVTQIGLTAKDTLVFLAIGNGLDNGVLVTRTKFEGTGTYTLKDQQGFYYTTLGGDALTGQYMVDQGLEGVFSITEYDGDTRSVRGSFSLPLKATRLSSGSGAKDSTLLITDGHFNGTIQEEILH